MLTGSNMWLYIDFPKIENNLLPDTPTGLDICNLGYSEKTSEYLWMIQNPGQKMRVMVTIWTKSFFFLDDNEVK